MEIWEVKKESIADQVATQIRRLILNDALKPKTKLPPERDLAQRFGTNRNTLREALRMLEEEGLISVRHGGGMEVLDYRTHGGIQLLPHYLRDMDDPNKRMAVIMDAIHLRRLAMGMVARMCAQNLTEDGERDLDVAMTMVREAYKQGHNIVEADLGFYSTIGRATGSLVLTWLINTVIEITKGMITDPRLWVIEEDYLSNMEEIYEAIKARTPDKAEASVRRRFEKVDDLIVSKILDVMKGGRL